MKMLIAISIYIFSMIASTCAYSQASYDEGTYEVSFKPNSTQGELDGCMLEYIATYNDQAYHHGRAYIVSGFIGVYFIRDSLALVLKAGTAKLDSKIKTEEPYFIFAKTKNYSTARFKGNSATGENKFKISVFPLFENLQIMEFVNSMVSEKSISIGYNLKKDGMDVVVPIDLTVKNTIITNDRGYVRANSDEMINSFFGCYQELLDKQLKSAEKIIGKP
ncbi:hypothetical protein ACNFH5_29270 [Pseudomonas sp. NY15435]|uniref:hypothetical protein n=1 Tax=Pseudomonas sp. NY15435 TaxID=3400358 RepID=UPI003A88A751